MFNNKISEFLKMTKELGLPKYIDTYKIEIKIINDLKHFFKSNLIDTIKVSGVWKNK
jgi:hypothetical protein